MDDRIRTGDRLDHNQELYQLSYAHRAALNLAGQGGKYVLVETAPRYGCGMGKRHGIAPRRHRHLAGGFAIGRVGGSIVKRIRH